MQKALVSSRFSGKLVETEISGRVTGPMITTMITDYPPLGEERVQTVEVEAIRSRSGGQRCDLVDGSFGVHARLVRERELLAEPSEDGVLVFGEIAVDARHPIRHRVDEEALARLDSRQV